MRALLFALAALSFFAAFSAYTDDLMYDEDAYSSYYRRASKPNKLCLDRYCPHGRSSNRSLCFCGCRRVTARTSLAAICMKRCSCLGRKNEKCRSECYP